MMSVLTTYTSLPTMIRIALTARASCLLLRCPTSSSLLSSPTSYYSRPTIARIASQRAIHNTTRQLQSSPALKAVGQTSSKSRSRVSSTSSSTSSTTAATTTSTFRNTTTKAQRAASLSTRKVATLTSAGNASIVGMDSAPPLVAAVATTCGRSARPIILSPLSQQPAAGARTRMRATNASTATKATTTITGNPISTSARKPKLFRSWPKKVSSLGNAWGAVRLSGSGTDDSNGAVVNREPSPALLLKSTPAFPSFDPFALPGRYRTVTAQSQTQEPGSLPFLDFRTNDSREVMYTKCNVEADQWLNSNPSKLWALDAEWRPFAGHGKQGRMSLVQLGDDRTVYLFHIIHMKKFPEALARILQDSHIFKVGINIRNDATKMFKDWGVGCASLVELGALSIQVQDDLSSQRKIRSMERLAEELLQHSVEKVPLTRMGNWESNDLSANQLAYAANDVFVTYVVAEKIKELQMTRPKQDYVLPLATVHSEGTTVVTVRGSLQERLDSPATLEDIIVPVPKQVPTILRATTVGGSAGAKRSPAATRYTKTPKTKVAGSSQATKRRTGNAAAPVASSTGMSGRSSKAPVKATTKKPAAVLSQTTTISPVSAKRTYEAWPKSSRTRTGKDSSEFSPTPVESNNLNTRVDPYFFYGNTTSGDNSRSSSSSSNGTWSSIGANDLIRTIRTGSKSTVTIIPRRFQKRSISSFPSCYSRQFSSSASAIADNKRPGPSDFSDRKHQEGENGNGGERGGNVFFPGRLLPDSLEGKDILERNQSVWLEAGGRDLSEDGDVGVGAEADEQDDWHLRQNQALFASLVTPNSDSDSDSGSDAVSDLGKGMGLKDLESVLDKDVVSSLLRRKP